MRGVPHRLRFLQMLRRRNLAPIFAGGVPDETAPTLSSPTDTETGGTTGSGSVSTNESNGTLYWVVTTSATSPSAAQVKAGQDHLGAAATDSGSQAVNASGAQNVSFSGLTSETTYYAHYMHEDGAANQSTVASADGFTTDDITAPTLSAPVDAANGSDAGTGSVDTDEDNGTLYWVVTQSATSPSAAQVKAGQDHTGAAADDSGSQAVSGTGTQNVAFTGLVAETSYFAHYMHEDAAANQSSVSSADGFTTASSFSPLDLFSGGEDGFWYDFSDLSTLWQDTGKTTQVALNNDPIGAVDDKSGNGNHCNRRNSDANRPLYMTAGGLHWAEFDGVSDYMSVLNDASNDLTASLSALTVVVGLNLSIAPINFSTIIRFEGASFAVRATFRTNTSGVFDIGGRREDADTFQVFNGTNAFVSGPIVVIAEWLWSTSDAALEVNGASEISTTSFQDDGVTDATSGRIFWGGIGSEYLDGSVFGMIAIDRALTSQEKSNVRAWMEAKAGI